MAQITRIDNEEVYQSLKEIKELELVIEEYQALLDGKKDFIKAVMGDEEEIIVKEYKVCYKKITSNRIDTSALKKIFSAEDLAPFTKTTTSRRFQII